MLNFAVILGWVLVILAVELLLWVLFRTRAVRIFFSGNGKVGSGTEYSPTIVRHLRITALHALTLIVSVLLLHIFLW